MKGIMDVTPIRECRVCGNRDLVKVLDLGSQAATGMFPRSAEERVFIGPLELIKCVENPSGDTCGLVQLGHRYDPALLYGVHYGYRSGLNSSMVAHLRGKAELIKQRVALTSGDAILDIGSNDGTFLATLIEPGVTALGMDPSAEKFRKYYRPEIQIIPEFFSAAGFRRHFGAQKLKVVTSIAMFYDLDEPLTFMQEVASLLADDGIWVFEQSYLPTMVEQTSYDTVCHEHQEYYALKQIVWMAARAGLAVIDVELNNINGGSFSVVAAPSKSAHATSANGVQKLLANEQHIGFGSLAVYEDFRERVFRHREELLQTLQARLKQGKVTLGYGASTKGNVILQFCGLTPKELPAIADVNPDKFGCHTPGTHIPIISEQEAHALRPNAFLVLPWHFRQNLLEREASFLASGGEMIFPLPRIEAVGLAESHNHRM
jgi:SAM-dependent methyltransferase